MSELYLVVAMIGTFGAVMLFALVLNLASDQHKRSVRLLEAQVKTSTARTANLREKQLTESFLQRALVPFIASAGQAVRRITPLGTSQRLEKKLILAGSPSGWDAQKVAAFKVIGGFLGLLMGGVLLSTSRSGFMLLLAIGAVYFGYSFPNLVLVKRGQDRQLEIQRSLPDTMDLLTITVEAGLGFDAAIAQVVNNDAGPLSQELSRMLQEIRLGIPRGQALNNLADRTDVREIDSFVTSMVQAEQFGVSITKVLRAQALDLRSKRRQRAEEKAQKLAVKLVFPLIFCIMPAIFVVTVGPAALQLLTSVFSG